MPVKDWATSTFGTNDKNVLLTGVFVVLFLYAMAVGAVAVRRLSWGFAGLAFFAVIGLAAALSQRTVPRPTRCRRWAARWSGRSPCTGSVLTAREWSAAAFSARAAAQPLPPIVFGDPGSPDQPRAPDLPDLPGEPGEPGETHPPDLPAPTSRRCASRCGSRRPGARFLATAGVTVFAAAVGEVAGRQLTTRRNVTAARSALRFPKAAVPAPPLPRGVNLPVPGISSFITPDSQFYRVDTALFVPQVDPSNWQLRIHGMVARGRYVRPSDELLRRPLIEDYITPLLRDAARWRALHRAPSGRARRWRRCCGRRACSRGVTAAVHVGRRVHVWHADVLDS